VVVVVVVVVLRCELALDDFEMQLRAAHFPSFLARVHVELAGI
jgi:hypothetical protein